MRSFLFVVCAGLVLGHATTARADDASKQAKIEQMLTLMHVDNLMQQTMDQMKPLITEQSKKMGLQSEAAEDMQKQISALIFSKLSWEKLKPVYIEIYSETLTDDEITASIAFYSSPAGQSMMKKLPMLMQKSTLMVQQMMGDLLPEINKISDDVAKKYKKQ